MQQGAHQLKQTLNRFDAMRGKAKQVAELAKRLYGVDLSQAPVSFNLKGRVAGWAGCKICEGRKMVSFRFNCELIEGDHFEDMMTDTVPHELAHGVCYLRPELGRKHDAGWRRVCVALGGNGNTRHNYETTPRGGGITYRAACGTEVTVSKLMHQKIQAGTVRKLKKTSGRVDRYCAWAPQHQPLPAVPQMRKIGEMVIPGNKLPAPPVAPTPAPAAVERKVLVAPVIPVRKEVRITKDGELTWAEKVRCLIRAHKALGHDINKVIELAILDLGMTCERARSCVKAHWNKV